MITVNSKNRGAAKKLLTLLGHDSVQVRSMTVTQLSQAIQFAINRGLITESGAQHALGIDAKRAETEARGEAAGSGERDSDDTDNSGNGTPEVDSEMQEGDDGAAGEASEHEGESESEAEAEGEGEESEGEAEAESEGDAEGEEQEGETESEGESESEGDSEADDDDSGEDSEKESDRDEEGAAGEESEQDETLTCDCCGKVCTQSELSAGAEGTPREGEALCEDCDAANNGEEIEHAMLSTVLKYVGAGLNVALVGPAGTGKSYMARQVAEKLGRDFYVNGAMLSKYDLIGYNDAGGTYHATPAHDAFVLGGVHCFDELDASAPDAVVAFNGMTDDQPFYTFPNGQQDQHADYVAIACMNTYGNGANADYVGRYKQDAASMSRFVKVFIDYDARVEQRCGSHDIVTRVQAVRAACATLAIRHIVSTRMIIQAQKARDNKATKREIDRDIIFAGLDDSAIRQIKAEMKKAAAEGEAS